MDLWQANPATFISACGWNDWHEILRRNGITRGVQSQEVCRITKNKARIDNTSEGRQTTFTSFEGPSERLLMEILGIDRPWMVSSVSKGMYPEAPDFRDRPLRGEVRIGLDVEKTMHPCPFCGCLCKVHQYETRHYSHMVAFGMAVVLKARVPKLRCHVCDGYPQMDVPWARPRVSYTRLQERQVFLFLCSMPVSEVAEHTGMTMWAIWDMVRYRVAQALERLDLSDVTLIYVDETSSKKGHNYITVICDQNGRIIFLCEGKGSSTIDLFADWLVAHRGDPDNIIYASCDLGDAYPAGIRRNFPNAIIVFDHFHAVKLLSDAFDILSRREISKHGALRGLRRKLLMSPSSFSEEERGRLEKTIEDYKDLAEGYRLLTVFSSIYDYPDRESASHVLDLWFEDVQRFGCKEMLTAATSLIERRDGILNWFDKPVSNGFAEGINSLIQTTKRVARGYRNIDNFIAMIYLRDGHLQIRFDD